VAKILKILSDASLRSKSATQINEKFSRFLKDMKALLLDKVYVVNVIGNSSPTNCSIH